VVLATLYGAVAGRAVGPIVSTVPLGQPLSIRGFVVGTTPGRAVVATIGMGQPGSAGIPRNRIDILGIGDGTLQRAVPLDGGMPVVASDEQAGRVFVADAGMTGNGTGVLRALDGTSGAQLRAVPFHTQPTAAAVDGRTGRVFVVGGGSSWSSTSAQGTTSGHDPDVVRIFDARTLRLLRTLPLDSDPQSVMADGQSGRAFVTSLTDVWILDARTGRVVRKVNGVRQVLAVDARTHRAFVTRIDGSVDMLDAVTGRDLGLTGIRASIQVADGTPAVVDAATDHVFVLDNGRGMTGAQRRGGSVSVLDGASGRLLRTIPVGCVGTLPSAIALAPERHEAFVADEMANTVSVLDTRRWRVQRVIGVGPAPLALMWDARTGRLLVESIGTPDTKGRDAWAWLPPRVRAWLPFIPRPVVAPPAQPLPVASITVLDPAR